jgi:hypothetical protein
MVALCRIDNARKAGVKSVTFFICPDLGGFKEGVGMVRVIDGTMTPPGQHDADEWRFLYGREISCLITLKGLF